METDNILDFRKRKAEWQIRSTAGQFEQLISAANFPLLTLIVMIVAMEAYVAKLGLVFRPSRAYAELFSLDHDAPKRKS